MKLAVIVLVAACGNSATSPTPPAVATRPTPPTPAAVHDAAPTLIPPATTQLVTATIDDWSSTTATLQLWSRMPAPWHPVGAPWAAVIGSGGAAWGDGVHGNGAPTGRSGPRKHEGDRKNPAGVFALRGAYGYAATPPAGTTLPYVEMGRALQCVDDPASAHYGQILDRGAGADWKSAEQMRRSDALYTWVVEVAHNAARTPGDGSCIFLHVWDGPDSTTVGCTAMAEPVLAHLIGVLDPRQAPMFVLLPRAEYSALAASWGLPPLSGPATLRP